MPLNKEDLKLENYDYTLPDHLVAKRPLVQRDQAKMLVYDHADESITHSLFKYIPEFLPQDSLLVLNQTRVFPCRLLGSKKTGGKAEIFVLSLKGVGGKDFYPCMIRTSNKKHEGDCFDLPQGFSATVERCLDGGRFAISFKWKDSEVAAKDVVEKIGMVPIPPYIREGQSDERDSYDYQTVYARHEGSVAAPTAGLHFTESVLSDLKQKIKLAHITLHVGPGTFAPVKAANITDHKMHTEHYFVDCNNAELIQNALKDGRPIYAVGTTTLRCLESAFRADGGMNVAPDTPATTNLFLYPGKEVDVVSGLLTNFHLPKSSLLMLVSALIGRERALNIYKEAVNEEYRFFSYGDVMLIHRENFL